MSAKVQKQEIHERLKRLGAFYISDADDAHEIWCTAWGFHFWVPSAGPYGWIYEIDLAEIEEAVAASKP